jgi:MoaA/NifB/PqqE/SkfB family radical SAM enzyme
LISRDKDGQNIKDVDKIAQAFLRLDDPCTVVLCGGEPFFQKNLIEVCSRISCKHYLEFVTNLSFDITDIINKIPPNRIINLSISLHIDERERTNGVPALISKIHSLKEHGYHYQLSQVLYPPVLSRYDSIFDQFSAEGITVYPKTFEGEYEGKRYPNSYTDTEKGQILSYILATNTDMVDVRHAADILMNAPPEGKLFSFKGQPCSSGYDDIVILQDGSVTRCWNTDFRSDPEVFKRNCLGNFFDGTFKWHKQIEPCTYDVCYCPLMGFECTKRANELLEKSPMVHEHRL